MSKTKTQPFSSGVSLQNLNGLLACLDSPFEGFKETARDSVESIQNLFVIELFGALAGVDADLVGGFENDVRLANLCERLKEYLNSRYSEEGLNKILRSVFGEGNCSVVLSNERSNVFGRNSARVSETVVLSSVKRKISSSETFSAIVSSRPKQRAQSIQVFCNCDEASLDGLEKWCLDFVTSECPIGIDVRRVFPKVQNVDSSRDLRLGAHIAQMCIGSSFLSHSRERT